MALALHPNLWHGHGPGQVASWIGDAGRAGLLALPPEEGWRAAVVAADAVVGDHGSVAYYSAAVGRPVILDQAGLDSVAPASPIARLLSAATPFDPRRPLTGLLARAEEDTERTTAIAREWVSSRPGRSLALLRGEMYRLMGAEEPTAPAPVDTVAPPAPLPGPEHPALWVSVGEGSADGALRVRRFPAAVLDRPGGPDEVGFLMAWDDEPDQRLSDLADIVVCPAPNLPEDGDAWCGRVFAHRVGAQAAAYYDEHGFVLHTRDGGRADVTVLKAPDGLGPSLPVAVFFHRLAHTEGRSALRPGSHTMTLTFADGTADPLSLHTEGG